MSWDNEAEQGFPPRRHREPNVLRQDILDELTDHLAQAAEREWDTGSQDEQEVRSRVLTQFGNPAAVARALWWDAMKETVMKDWIQISISAVLCIGVVGFMALIYGQMQSSNAALLSALNDRPNTIVNTDPSVEFIFHRGSVDGPTVEGLGLKLVGKAFGEETTEIFETSDSQGRARFGPFQPGRYNLQIEDGITEQRGNKQVTLYSGEGTRTVHLTVPPTTPVDLDVTTPVAGLITNADFRLMMRMRVYWSNEGMLWSKGPTQGVIISPDGIFHAERHSDRSKGYRPGEKITQVYGNHVIFEQLNILQSHYPKEGDDEWFSTIRYSTGDSSFRSFHPPFDLRPGEANSIVVDLPDEIIDEYRYQVRLSANSSHGYSDSTPWYSEIISEEFTDLLIDDARLVEQSFEYRETEDGQAMYGNVIGNVITRQQGRVYSLKNVPRSVPDGYKLLLALNIQMLDSQQPDVNLCAYLDISPASYATELPEEKTPLQHILEPVWKLDANSLDKHLFVDLTDVINEDPDIERATGILLKWESSSKNELLIHSGQRGVPPVWLILKPIEDGV